LRCSFCGKAKEQVQKFIAGPAVYICNECVALCNEILDQDEPTWKESVRASLLRQEVEKQFAGIVATAVSKTLRECWGGSTPETLHGGKDA